MKKRILTLLFSTVIFGGALLQGQPKVLIDLGNDGTYRGASVVNPDVNLNNWNSVGYSTVANLVAKDGAPTSFGYAPAGIGGTDSYNGPAGDTTVNTPADSVYDSVALGDLGIDEAVYDFFSTGSLQITGLDPGSDYELILFASRKFSGTTTTFTILDTLANTLTSGTLDHGDGGGGHNQDQLLTLTGVTAPSDGILVIQYAGYINCMSIEGPNYSPPPLPGQDSVLIDFGKDGEYRSVSVPNPDTKGNYWNSVGLGSITHLVDETGSDTGMRWAPQNVTVSWNFDPDTLELIPISTIGGVDSFNGPAGATTNPPTAAQVEATAIDVFTLGNLGTKEAGFDYYVASRDYSDPQDAIKDPARFQIQNVTEGQLYDLTFFSSHKYTATNYTTFRVYSDSDFTILLGSVTLQHGEGNANHNTVDTATIAGLVGPSYPRTFYVEWEGTDAAGTPVNQSGYINSMRMNFTTLETPVIYTALGGSTFTLSFISQENVDYQLQVNLSLNPDNWVDDGIPIPGDGNQQVINTTAPGSGKVFYRLVATQTAM